MSGGGDPACWLERVCDACGSVTDSPVCRTCGAGVQIRLVDASELDRLRSLRLRALQDAPAAFGSTYAEEVGRPVDAWASWVGGANAATFVAEDGDGRWHGLALGLLDAEEPGLAHVLSMWVAPEVRGAGIGRQLLTAVVDWVRAHGADRVRLGVADGNDAALRLYTSFGFTPTGDCEPLRSDPTRQCAFFELVPD